MDTRLKAAKNSMLPGRDHNRLLIKDDTGGHKNERHVWRYSGNNKHAWKFGNRGHKTWPLLGVLPPSLTKRVAFLNITFWLHFALNDCHQLWILTPNFFQRAIKEIDDEPVWLLLWLIVDLFAADIGKNTLLISRIALYQVFHIGE